MQKFCRERLKKVVQKFRLKFGPPGSEVLDPVVVSHVSLYNHTRSQLARDLTHRKIVGLCRPTSYHGEN